MTLIEVLEASRATDKVFARKNWTHDCWIRIRGERTAYGNGELFWETGERVHLFYVDDLTAADWHLRGEEP